MRISTPTVWADRLNAAERVKKPHEVLKFSTLNEHFDVLANIEHDPTTYPKLSLFAIGNGGHTMTADETGFMETKYHSHEYLDAGLFNYIPFVARPISNDLSSEERAKYAMRRKETLLDGAEYWVYYLKWAEPIDSKVITRIHGTSIQEFTPTLANLNPTPKELSSTEMNELKATIVETFIPLDIRLNSSDINEVINACLLKFGNENRAIISEMALCHGHTYRTEIDVFGNTTDVMDEAIAVQVNQFLKMGADLRMQRTLFGQTINVGGSEPLVDVL